MGKFYFTLKSYVCHLLSVHYYVLISSFLLEGASITARRLCFQLDARSPRHSSIRYCVGARPWFALTSSQSFSYFAFAALKVLYYCFNRDAPCRNRPMLSTIFLVFFFFCRSSPHQKSLLLPNLILSAHEPNNFSQVGDLTSHILFQISTISNIL